jgi:hypothetical protein
MSNHTIFILLAVIFAIHEALLVSVIIRLSKTKKSIQKTNAQALEAMASRIPSLNVNQRLEYNKNLLSFIDDMINLEILNEKRFSIFLNQPDKNLDIDNVLKKISTKVFESIQPELYNDPNNILTSEYIMSYIQKKTFIVCLTYIQNNVASQL